MPSWQRLRFSLHPDRSYPAENVCWRCALQQTQRYSSTVRGNESGKEWSTQATHDALVRSPVAGPEIHKYRSLAWLIRKKRVSPKASSKEMNHGLRLRRVMVDEGIDPGLRLRKIILDAVSQSESSQENVQKSGKPIVAADTQVRRRDHNGLHQCPRIHKRPKPLMISRRTLMPQFQAILDRIRDDENKEARMAMKIGYRSIPLDTASQSKNPPQNVHKPGESTSAGPSQNSLNDVLNAFEDLFNRLDKDSPNPVGGLQVDSSRSTKSNSIMRHTRSYTTSTARYTFHGSAASAPVGRGPVIETPPKSHVGIRDHLRAWQEQNNVNPDLSMAFSIPDSKFGSNQNISQSMSSDGNDSLTREDESFEDEIALRVDAEDQVTDVGGDETYLRKGDLVELLTIGEPVLAILVRNFTTQSQFYTMQGKWVHRLSRKIKFGITPFSPPGAVDQILPYLPTEQVAEDKLDKLQTFNTSVPREAAAPLIKKMLDFHRAANSIFRKHSERLDRAYKLLAHSMERKSVTLEEAATKLLEIRDKSKLTNPMLWAVHRVLIKTEGIRIGSKNHRLSPIFDVLPHRGVDEISRVRQWFRDYQEQSIANAMTGSDPDLHGKLKTDNPFYKFLAKAQALITESRRTRAFTREGSIGPSSVKVDSVEPEWAVWKRNPGMRFDSSEQQILEFMNQSINANTVLPGTSLAALGPMILRATGMYEGCSLRADTGSVFLQEMGVIPPWHNRLAYNTTLNLPGHRLDHETDRLALSAQNSVGGFTMKDSMQDFRRDWGDLEVFCIDDADVAERDDGISLEPVAGNDSEHWIHIHIANPSAFITVDSSLARFAAHLGESIYFPEQRFPMLMSEIVDEHFSLANNRPSITFSARMKTDGEILETRIVNGILRKVRHLSRQTLQRYISSTDEPPPPKTKNIFVGGGGLGLGALSEGIKKQKTTTAETLDSLTESQIAILCKLSELGVARRHKRERDGGIDMMASQVPKPDPSVYFQAVGRAPLLFSTKASQRTEGDPIISMDETRFDPTPRLKYHFSDTLVPDCMVLAGEIAATWCGQRNIPIAYRGTLHNPEPAMPPEQFKKEVIDVAVAKQGFAPLIAKLRYFSLIGRSSLSTSPLRHTILGAPNYCKITSPLRRYADLMGHWQIEAAIRYEAETGTSLIGNTTNDAYLPFPFSKAEAAISHIMRREDIISQCSRGAARHWYTQLLFRAFYFKEAPLPETFEVYVYSANSTTQTDKVRWSGLMKEYGISVDLDNTEVSDAAGGIGIGDWWEARIERIETYSRYIVMSPVRLIERPDYKWSEPVRVNR